MERLNFGLLSPVIEAAARENAKVEGDYFDEEGFLCCGKCHTRKQCEVKLPEGLGRGRTERFPVMCECRRKAVEAEEAAELKRKEMEVVQRLRKESLMSPRFEEATFQNFRVDQANAYNLKLCRRYAEHFDKMVEKNQGLIFYGDVGTGKTFAAACIANHLLSRGVPVVMTSFIKLLSSMQTFGNDNERLIANLNRAKLLIIDDLGAERDTDFAQEHVYNIIDSRYRAKLPLIITTNMTIQEIREPNSTRYARIYDRLSKMLPMEFAGGSWRKDDAARSLTEMKKFLEGSDG